MFEACPDDFVLWGVCNTVNFSPSYPTDTDYLRWVFPKYLKRTVFRVCYNRLGQKVSICDYWNGENEEGVLQRSEKLRRTCTSCKRHTTNTYIYVFLHRPSPQALLPERQQLSDVARWRQTSQRHER